MLELDWLSCSLNQEVASPCWGGWITFVSENRITEAEINEVNEIKHSLLLKKILKK